MTVATAGRPAVGSVGVAVIALTAIAVGWWLVVSDFTAWALSLGLLAVAAWVVAGAAGSVGRAGIAGVAGATAVLAGALAGPATSGNTLLPAVLAMIVLIGNESVPILLAAATTVAAAGLVAVGALLHPVDAIALITMIGAIGLGTLGGLNRRQARRNQRQAADLADRERAAHEEAVRMAVARDLHDVLAHTLGGLVIQLDAAEALLEAGRPEAATIRVADARTLAGTGLGEARRAVAALRDPAADPGAPAGDAEFPAALADLVDAHRSLGGEVTVAENGSSRPLTVAQATALERAVREALSNARRHAPGRPVTLRVDWTPHDVRLLVSNPVAGPAVANRAAQAAPSGVGYGLAGMAERFAALPDGGSVESGVRDGRFVVRARVALAAAAAPATTDVGRR